MANSSAHSSLQSFWTTNADIASLQRFKIDAISCSRERISNYPTNIKKHQYMNVIYIFMWMKADLIKGMIPSRPCLSADDVDKDNLSVDNQKFRWWSVYLEQLGMSTSPIWTTVAGSSTNNIWLTSAQSCLLSEWLWFTGEVRKWESQYCDILRLGGVMKVGMLSR